MSISSDQSRFTACLLGEVTPVEQSAFDAALLRDGALREEAVSLSRTAHQLANALKQESSVSLSLTPAQRQSVLNHGKERPIVAARKPSRRAWSAPTLATAGIAAVLAIALYALPEFHSKPQDNTPDGSMPAVALKPSPPTAKPGRPVLPLPPLAQDSAPGSLAIPDAKSPNGPVQSSPQNAMAATPPVIRVIPSPATPEQPVPKDHSAPVRSSSGKTGPAESLASPAPRKP